MSFFVEPFWLQAMERQSPRVYLCFNCALRFDLDVDQFFSSYAALNHIYAMDNIQLQANGFAIDQQVILNEGAEASRQVHVMMSGSQLVDETIVQFYRSAVHPVLDFRLCMTETGMEILFFFHHAFFDGLSARHFIYNLWESYFSRKVSYTQMTPDALRECEEKRQGKRIDPQLFSEAVEYYQQMKCPEGLPAQYPASTQSHYYYFCYCATMADKIREYCRVNNMSLFVFFTTVYELWLTETSKHRNVVYKMAVSGRSRAKLLGVLGCLANSVAVAQDVDATLSFQAHAQRVKENCANAIRFGDIPFGGVVASVPELSKIQYFYNFIPCRKKYKQHAGVYHFQPESNYIYQMSGDDIRCCVIVMESHDDCLGINLKFDRAFYSSDQARSAMALFNTLIYNEVSLTKKG